MIYFSHKDFCISIEKIVLYIFRLLVNVCVLYAEGTWVFRINMLMIYYKAVLDIKIHFHLGHTPFDQKLFGGHLKETCINF